MRRGRTYITIISNAKIEDLVLGYINYGTKKVETVEETAVIKPEEGHAPEFVLKIKTQTITEGETVDFNCEVIGEPKPDLHWLCNGHELTEEGKYMVFEDEKLHHLEVYDITPEDAGTYAVEAENKFGKVTCTAELQVTAKPVEEVKELEAPKFVVEIQTVETTVGEKATFTCRATGKPTPEILWYKNDKEITKTDNRFTIQYGEDCESSLLIVDVLPEHDGTYTAEAKNEAGTAKCKAELFVEEPKDEKLSPPEFIKVPEKVVAREHDRAQFLVKVVGMPKPTVAWKKDKILDDKDLYDFEKYEDTYCFEIKDTETVDSGVYTCIATNEAGEATCEIPLEVTEIARDKRLSESPLVLRHKDESKAPEFTEIFEECTVMEEKPLTLIAKVTGLPRPEVAWFNNGKALTNTPAVKMSYDDETTTLLIKKSTVDHEGEFKCVATNSAGTAEHKAKVNVEGKSEPPEFTRKVNSRDIKAGRPVRFECAVKGIPQPEVTWFINDKPIETGIRFRMDERKGYVDVTHILTIDNTVLEDEGQIKAVATNKAGEVSCEGRLTVEEKKEGPKLIKRLENLEVVEKSTVVFECVISGKPKPDIVWMKDKTELVASEDIKLEVDDQTYRLTIPSTKVSDSDLYTIRASNPAGQVSCSCRLKVMPGRKPSFARKMSDTLVPEEGAVSFDCKVEGLPLPDVKWFINDQEIEEGEGVHFVFNKRDRTHSLVIDKALPELQGLVKAVAVNSGGEELCTAELTVRGRAPTFKEIPLKCTILEGSMAMFRCIVDGEPKPTIAWSKGKWQKIKDDKKYHVFYDEETDEQVLEIRSVQKKDAGTYLVTISNEHGTCDAPATLMVTNDEEDVNDWLEQLKHREFTRHQGDEAVEWMPQLRHVEQEGDEPDAKKFVPGTKELEEATAHEIFRRSSRPELTDAQWEYEMSQRSKVALEASAPEKGAEVTAPRRQSIKDKYSRLVKPQKIEEAPPIKLVIPKASWKVVTPLHDLEVMEMDEARFECEFSVPNVMVTWKVNGQPIEATPKYMIEIEKTKHTLIVTKCKPKDSCNVSCSYAKLFTEANLVVNEMPIEFLIPLEDTSAVEHTSATFTVKINVEEVDIIWLVDNEPIKDDKKFKVARKNSQVMLTVLDLKTDDTCKISAKARDISTECTLTVTEIPVQFIVPLKDMEEFEHESVTFVCEVQRDVDKVQWFIDDRELVESDIIKFVSQDFVHKLYLKDLDLADNGVVTFKTKGQSCSANLKVKEIPVEFTIPLADITAMEHSTVEFISEINRDVEKVTWFLDDEELKEEANIKMVSEGHVHKLIIEDIQVEDEGQVTLQAKDKKTSASLFVQELPPEFTSPPSDVTIMEGETAEFVCKVSKEGTTVKWFLDDKEIVEDERFVITKDKGTHTLTIKDAILPDGGLITAKVEDTSATATLTVKESPVEIVLALEEQHIEEHQACYFTCNVNKDDVDVTWYKNDEVISPSDKHILKDDGTSHTLVIMDADESDIADYTVTVGDRKSSAKLCLDEKSTAEILHPLTFETKSEFLHPINLETEAEITQPQNLKPNEEIIESLISETNIDNLQSIKPDVDTESQHSDQAEEILSSETETESFNRNTLETNVDNLQPFTPETVNLESINFETEAENPETLNIIHETETFNVESLGDIPQPLNLGSDEESFQSSSPEIETLQSVNIETEAEIPQHTDMQEAFIVESMPETVKPLSLEPEPEISETDTQEAFIIESMPEIVKPLSLEPEPEIFETDTQEVSLEPEPEISETDTQEACIVECMPEIVKPLSLEPESENSETATLVCEVSNDGVLPTWLKDGQPLGSCDKYTLTNEDCVHKLTIHNLVESDNAEYSLIVGEEITSISFEDIPISLSLTLKCYCCNDEHLATFMCSTSKEQIKVTWFKDECLISPSAKHIIQDDGDLHVLTIRNLCMNDYGKYLVVIGRKRTSEEGLVKELPIQFMVPLEEQTCMEGESVTFLCEVSKEDAPAKWFCDGEELVPSDRIEMTVKGKVHQLTIKDAVLDDRAEYTIKLEDKSSTAPLFVEEAPLRITVPLKDRYDCSEGESITMECQVNKPGLPAMWLKDGEQITVADGYEITVDGNRHILTIPEAYLDHEADYSVMIGSQVSSTVLYVEEVAAAFTHRLTDLTGMEGEDVELSVELSKPDVNVSWMKNKKPLTASDRIKILCDRYRHVLQIQEAIPEDEGEYTIQLNDKSESSAMLTIQELPPAFKRPLEDIKATEKDNVKLECEVNKEEIPVKWFKDGKEITPTKRMEIISNGCVQQLVIDDVTLDDMGKYTCMCGDASTEAVLSVEELPPEFRKLLEDQTSLEKLTVTLECELSKPDIPVKWLKDGEEISPTDNITIVTDGYLQQLLFAEVSLADSATYTCVCGNVSTKATLKVEEEPPKFTKPLEDQTVTEEATLVLECALSKPNYKVQWFKDGEQIKPSDRVSITTDGCTQRLELLDVTLDDMAKYSCVCGNVSTEATVTVEEIVLAFRKPLEELEVLEGTTVKLECELNKKNMPSKWCKDDKEIVPNDQFSISVDQYQHSLTITDITLDDEADYKCIVKDVSTSATVFVEELPVEFIIPLTDITVMENDAICLNCEVNKPEHPATWLKDGKEIKPRDGLKLIHDNAYHRIVIDTAELDDEAEYSVVINGAKSRAIVLVEEAPVEYLKPLKDTQVTEGDSVTMECEVSKPDEVAKWYLDGEEIKGSDRIELVVYSKTHQLIIHEAKISDEGSVSIKIGDKKSTANLLVDEIPLKIVKPLTDTEIFEKEEMTFTCEVNKVNVKATWHKDGVEIVPSDHIHVTVKEMVHTLKITDVKLDDGAIYLCQLEDKKSTATLTVKEEPLQFIKPLGDVEVMEGKTAVLECIVSRPNLKSTWICEGKPLTESDRIKMTTQDNIHTLTITAAELDDEAEYTINVMDTLSTGAIFVEEEPVDFVRKLENLEVHTIPSSATFEAEVTKANLVGKWFRDSKPLAESDKYKMEVVGPVHRLTINDIDGEDEADYKVVIRGKKSEAELIVEVPPELFLDKAYEEEVILKAGQSTAFEIPFKANPQPSITWSFNDQSMPEDKRIEVQSIYNMTTLRLAKAKRTDTGNYTLTLQNQSGKAAVTIKLKVLDKPSVPRNFAPKDVTAESVSLVWETPEDDGGSPITEYIIEKREANRRSWTEIGTTTETQFVATKLLEGNQYVFRVFAKNDIGLSEAAELTDAVTAKNPFTVPDAPNAPVPSDIFKKSAMVSWQPPANDGGSPVIGYFLERLSGFSPRWVRAVPDMIPDTWCSLTDLVEDNTYQFRVIAVNKAGESEPSPPSDTITAKDPFDKPGPPSTPEIMGTDSSSVALKWTPPEDDGGSPIFNYVIEYRLVGAFRWTTANETAVPETTFSVTGLKEGSNYEFRVSAENKAGVGQPSPPTKPVKVQAPIVGVAPKLLEPLQDTVVIAPKDAILECDLDLGEPESDIKWFKGTVLVEKSPKYEMSYEDEIAALVIHDTTPEDADVYSCQAANVIGQVQTTGTLSVHTHPKLEYDNKLKSKQVLKAGSTLTVEINISGIPSPKVVWQKDGQPVERSPRLSIDITEEVSTLKIKNATQDDTGVYNIVAENTVGKAEASFDINVRDKPSKPNNLHVVEVMKDTVVIEWEKPTSDGGAEITSYIVEKRDAKRNIWATCQNVSGNTMTFAVEKLLEGNEYFFQVSAQNEVGTSEPATMDEGTIAKSPYDVPDSPINLKATDTTPETVSLTWDVPLKDGGSPVTGYMVEKRHMDTTRWSKCNKKAEPDTVFTVTDLIEDSDYEFRVSAENIVGLSKPCQPIGPIRAKLPYDKPEAPGKPEVLEVTRNTASLKWTPPVKDGGDAIFNYVVECRPETSIKWILASQNIRVDDTKFVATDLIEGMEYEFRVYAENRAGVGPASPPSDRVLIKEPIVGEAPSVLEGLPDLTYLVGETATLECKISGKPEPTLKWSKDERELAESKKFEMSYVDLSASLTIREVTEKDMGSYSCEASNDLGSVSTTGQVEIQAPPTIEYDNKYRDLLTLHAGSSLKIPVTITGLPKPTVTWGKDDAALKTSMRVNFDKTEKGSTLVIKKLTREDDGLYYIKAENEAGEEKASFDVEIIDVPSPPEGPVQVTDLDVDRATLTWQKSKDNGGAEIKSYTVERREAGRSTWTRQEISNAPVLTITPTDLQVGKEYLFRFFAENEVGMSSPFEMDEPVIPKSPFGRWTLMHDLCSLRRDCDYLSPSRLTFLSVSKLTMFDREFGLQ